MSKYTGGFINTLKPYSDETVNSKLIITLTYLYNVTELIEDLRDLGHSIKNKDQYGVWYGVWYSKAKAKAKAKASMKGKAEASAEAEAEVEGDTDFREKISKIENEIKTINNHSLLNFDNPLVDPSQIIKTIGTSIEKLKYLQQLTSLFLEINCFEKDNIGECEQLKKDDEKKDDEKKDDKKKDDKKKDDKKKIIKKYIGNTFGYYDCADKLKDIKYVILQKFTDEDKYYIVFKNCDLEEKECRWFIIKDNLSLEEVKEDDKETIKQKIRIIKETEKLYYQDTQMYNLSRGKMYKDNFLILINNIFENKIKFKDNPKIIFNIETKQLEDVLNFLYPRQRESNYYTLNLIKKYDNIFLFLAYINRVQIVYDNLDKDTPRLTEDLFLDKKDLILYGYNYYLFISNLSRTDISIEALNTQLIRTKEDTFKQFIEDVNNFYLKLIEVKKICQNSKLIKDLLSNFLEKMFNTNDLPLPINKEQIITTLTKQNALIKNNSELYISPKEEDKQYNYEEKFKVFNDTIVTYNNINFSNCGENTIFNLINYLLTHDYNKETKTFEYISTFKLDKLKRLNGEESELYIFYNEYKNFDNLYTNYNKSKDTINKFTDILSGKSLSDKPLPIYYIGNKCNIRPDETNLITLLNFILGQEFKSMTEFIKYFDPNHIITKTTTTFKLNNKYTMDLQLGHSSFNSDIVLKDIFSLIIDDNDIRIDGLHYYILLIYYSNTVNQYGSILHNIIYKQIPNKKLIDGLIDRGYNINTQDGHGNTQLHATFFARFHDIQTQLMEKLVELGEDINIQNIDKDTPLHLSIKYKNTKFANILINKLIVVKADIEMENKEGYTPLDLALNNDCPDIANKLVSIRKNIDITYRGGNKLLHVAVITNNNDLIETLIKKGADINIQNEEGNTPLHIAISHGYIDIVNTLIDKGADINNTNKGMNTPLHVAIKFNNTTLVNKLIDKRALINLKNEEGNTPLHLAILTKNNILAKRLIKLYTTEDINIQNEEGNTPLHVAISHGYIDIVNTLIDNGADINNTNKRMDTPLHLAIKFNNTTLVNKLIDKRALINLKNEEGNTPLHLAIMSRNNILAERLITELYTTEDINIQNEKGDTPLHLAIKFNNTEIANTLIENKAYKNLQNEVKYTPLHLAILYNRTGIANTLIDEIIKEKGNINLESSDGMTPLVLATRQDNMTEIVSKIKAYSKGGPIEISVGGNISIYKQKYIKYKQKYLQLKHRVYI
jgi:ankyrin repeat protein